MEQGMKFFEKLGYFHLIYKELKKMKKVLFCLLVSFLCLGLLSAQEPEGEAGMQEEVKQE